MNTYSALLLLNEAEGASCRFQQEKGAKSCAPAFEIDELKREAKADLVQAAATLTGPLFLLSETLAWMDRIKLTEEQGAYYDSFVKEMHETPPQPLVQALNNYIQKDYSESLQFFEKEKENLLSEVARIPLAARLESVLMKRNLSRYDVAALQDEKSLPAAYRLEQGERLWARLLLMARLQEVRREKWVKETPVDVLKNGIEELKTTILLQIFAREIKGFDQWDLIKISHTQSLEALQPFVPVARKWREAQFLKKGCETSPWAQVIPLVEKGKGKEASAGHLIERGEFPLALQDQTVALAALEEALKLLENPPPPSQTPQSKETLTETLRLFQDLEVSDRALLNQPSPVKNVEKPW